MPSAVTLVQTGQVSADAYVEAVARRDEERVRLGQLAIEAGLLSPRNVLELLHAQSRQQGVKFGQLAIDRGLLTRGEVGALLLEQHERQRPLEDHLRELGELAESARPGAALTAV